MHAGQTTRQVEPAQSRRRRPSTGESPVLGDEFDLPRVGRGLRDDEGQGRLGKLRESSSIGARGEEQLAGDSRCLGSGLPHSLTVADRPSGFGKIGGWKGGKGTTRGREDEKDERIGHAQEVEKTRVGEPRR